MMNNRDDGAEGCLVKITFKRIYIRNRTCKESTGFTEEMLKYCTPGKRFGHFVCEANVLGDKKMSRKPKQIAVTRNEFFPGC
jgi:hypothetical protein